MSTAQIREENPQLISYETGEIVDEKKRKIFKE